jgi:4-methyl-5(b-hydroxyethyl)-thiazole monophosphate biosynthesis
MKKVLLLLADGFEIFEASVFIDVIGWNLIDGDKTTKLYTCGLRKELKSTFGQKLIVDFTIDEINVDEFSALAVPGGFEEYGFYQDAYSDEFTRLISEFNQRKKLISSICTGAFPVAKSGALIDRRGTTYNKNPIRQESLTKLGVTVVNQPIVVDGNITTSWNPSTAMDVAFLLLESLTSKENTQAVKSLMGFSH